MTEEKIKEYQKLVKVLQANLKKVMEAHLELKKEKPTITDDDDKSGWKCVGHVWDGTPCQGCAACKKRPRGEYEGTMYDMCHTCKNELQKHKKKQKKSSIK